MQPLFKPGEEVVCLKDDWGVLPHYSKPTYQTPRKNEIYHVNEYWPEQVNGQWYFNLKEFSENSLFSERNFAPVLPTDQLEKELIEIFQPITII